MMCGEGQFENQQLEVVQFYTATFLNSILEKNYTFKLATIYNAKVRSLINYRSQMRIKTHRPYTPDN